MPEVHPLPDVALDADIAILGKKGRGKTQPRNGPFPVVVHRYEMFRALVQPQNWRVPNHAAMPYRSLLPNNAMSSRQWRSAAASS